MRTERAVFLLMQYGSPLGLLAIAVHRLISGSFFNVGLAAIGLVVVGGAVFFSYQLRRRTEEIVRTIDERTRALRAAGRVPGTTETDEALVHLTSHRATLLESLEKLCRASTPSQWIVKVIFAVQAAVRSRRSRIVSSPVSRLDAIARFIWSEKTYKTVFSPARADIIHEWHEAELRGERKRAFWIKHVRGPWTILGNMVWQAPFSLLKKVVAIVKSTIA